MSMNEIATMNSLRPLAALCAATLLGACSQLPPQQRPDTPLPQAWAGLATTAAPAAPRDEERDWRDFIVDPGLRTLVEQALAANRDARIAALQVEQLAAQYQIRRAALAPTVNLGLAASRQTSDSNQSFKNSASAGLQISAWEIDFFGRLASLREAALAQYLASEQAQRSTRIGLVAAVASGWLELQAGTAQLELTRQTLASREQSLRLVRLRHDSGTASALELRSAESLVESARATLAQQRLQQGQARHALALLVGQPLDHALELPPAPEAGAPAALAELAPGLPAQVLLERPDVRAAEQQLAAASAQIGAARAAFFPRIALTAAAGSASSELSGLFKAGSWGWSLAPQALLPIFDAGANQAGLDSARAGREIALAQYEKAIQVAFREVSDSLLGRATLAEQLAAQQALARAEAERLRLSGLRLQQGVASQLDVLDAQRSLFAAEQALVQTRYALLQNRVALFKATAGR
ncbi:MAG: hypothetical protein RJA36_874 [Pseudomonadota bacterium]|jgi:multidrug efflux system outer membrane protein